jgi:hypothetical protein
LRWYPRVPLGSRRRVPREDLGADDYRRRYLGAAAMPGYRFYRIAIADVAPVADA